MERFRPHAAHLAEHAHDLADRRLSFRLHVRDVAQPVRPLLRIVEGERVVREAGHFQHRPVGVGVAMLDREPRVGAKHFLRPRKVEGDAPILGQIPHRHAGAAQVAGQKIKENGQLRAEDAGLVEMVAGIKPAAVVGAVSRCQPAQHLNQGLQHIAAHGGIGRIFGQVKEHRVVDGVGQHRLHVGLHLDLFGGEAAGGHVGVDGRQHGMSALLRGRPRQPAQVGVRIGAVPIAVLGRAFHQRVKLRPRPRLLLDFLQDRAPIGGRDPDARALRRHIGIRARHGKQAEHRERAG